MTQYTEKMTTKARSIRLQESKFKEIDELCRLKGCNRNDFIKNAIEKELNGSNSSIRPGNSIEDRIRNCSCCDEAVKENHMRIINNLHDTDCIETKEDDSGRLESVEMYWNYEDES